MSLLWVYDLPGWLFCIICVAAFSALGLLALLPTRAWVRRQHRVDSSHNDIVGFYLATLTVIYGVTLGLVAVEVWTTYSDVQAQVDREAEVVSSLYRDAAGYPAEVGKSIEADLRDYMHEVIYVSWPQQRRGIVPTSSGIYIERLQRQIILYEPLTRGQQVLQAEVIRQYNLLVECRRARLDSTETGMPLAIWFLVILGTLTSITVSLFFDMRSLSIHIWMTVLISSILGLIIFLIGTLDHPFRGGAGVSSAALQFVYEHVAKGRAGHFLPN